MCICARTFWGLALCLAVLGLGCCAPGPFRRATDTDTDMKYVKSCNQSSPVSLATVNEVLVHKRLSDAEDEYRFQCFLHCLFTKYGWMDEEGGFLLGEMRRVLEETLDEPPVLHHLLYECTAIRETDRCRRALHFTKCFWEQLDQHQEDVYHIYNLQDPPEESFIDWTD